MNGKEMHRQTCESSDSYSEQDQTYDGDDDDDGNDKKDDRYSSNPINLEDFTYREVTSNITSSVSFLNKRITRKYASEFILPDNTHVAVSRQEGIYPIENQEQVFLNLSVAFDIDDSIHTNGTEKIAKNNNNQEISQTHANGLKPKETRKKSDNCYDSNKFSKTNVNEKFSNEKNQEIYSNLIENKTKSNKQTIIDNDNEYDSLTISSGSDQPLNHTKFVHGLQIGDYIEDDLWAKAIFHCDSSSNVDLLRQLEAGCRLDPDSYRMERVQRKKNLQTIIDFHTEPTIQTIGLSRTTSETDSIATTMTALDLEAEEKTG